MRSAVGRSNIIGIGLKSIIGLAQGVPGGGPHFLIGNNVTLGAPTVGNPTLSEDTLVDEFSLLAWNRPYVVMLPLEGLSQAHQQRLLVHAYADE